MVYITSAIFFTQFLLGGGILFCLHRRRHQRVRGGRERRHQDRPRQRLPDDAEAADHRQKEPAVVAVEARRQVPVARRRQVQRQEVREADRGARQGLRQGLHEVVQVQRHAGRGTGDLLVPKSFIRLLIKAPEAKKSS